MDRDVHPELIPPKGIDYGNVAIKKETAKTIHS